MTELTKRFASAEVLQAKSKPWSSRLLVLGIAIVLLTCLAPFYTSDFLRLHVLPETRLVPVRMLLQPVEGLHERRHGLCGFSFCAPKDFTAYRKGDEFVLLKQENKNTRLKAVFKSDISIPRSLRYLVGAEDEHDVRAVAYNARFGLVPLVLKAITLPAFHVTQIYEVERSGLQGFLMRGKRGRIWTGKTMLVDKSNGVGIDFTLSSTEPIDMRAFDTIIGSLRYAKRPER